MNDFWNNIFRYPRFFISSLIGLILVILAPFTNLLKMQKFRIFAFLFGITFFILLSLIIKTMIAL